MLQSLRKAFCLIMCIVLCSLHIWYIADQYYEYQCVTQVEIRQLRIISVPVFTFCSDIGDLKAILKTVEYMLTKTLDENQIIDYAYDQLSVFHKQRKFYAIKRSFKKLFVCYTLEINEDITYPLYHYNRLTTQMIYRIVISEKAFPNSSFVYLSLSSSADGFRGPTSSETKVDRGLINGNYALRNNIEMTYSHIISNRLEEPYQTRCF